PEQHRVKLYLTYPKQLVKEPLIWRLARDFDLMFNIRGASVNEEIGIIAIELDGPEGAIERAITWLREQGVTVEPIEKNVIEGRRRTRRSSGSRARSSCRSSAGGARSGSAPHGSRSRATAPRRRSPPC